MPGALPDAALRRHVHAAQPERQPDRPGQHRRAALGRHGLGRDEPPGDCPGQPARRHHPADPERRFPAARRAAGRTEVTEQKGTPYAMSREFFFSPEGRPCLSPPWGELVAVRVDTGEIAWRSVLGDLRELVGLTAAAVPASTGSPNLGGPAVTAGGVRVHRRHHRSAPARVRDRRWPRAVEGAPPHQRARDAARLHHAGRREMVAIAAGGHDTPLSKPARAARFALPTPSGHGWTLDSRRDGRPRPTDMRVCDRERRCRNRSDPSRA